MSRRPKPTKRRKRINQWWTRNRAAPKELAHAFTILGMQAGVGVRYAHRTIPGLHRFLLRSTLYHLYFVYSDDLGSSYLSAGRQG